ncbi:hypothetical protein Rhe02_49220 [Rhizocola hellebori]|uniref:Right-handed parallel beta-helix repeat-containing protein n=1 Tax=Rhizocola hellebori TaxID=1392758 RepID=A0A8J3QAC8_9ACTN|nr:DUF6519 domain-containing protein [Rhizocola hellebori]GIH06855.1 hypothetical protein Rhe02_49220 [Rhizocola hellebori]
MSADLSRVRFDPLRDHSGIGSLQGRVWLDADFNEQVAITDRRVRAQMVDLAPTPSIVSRLTPDAFKITEAGGVISIGAGRLYVDGLLAENHGLLTKTDLEPILAEPNGNAAIAYTQQPYRRDVTDAPTTGGQHLFYLVAWQRELDHLNTPDLVEPAIGVETTTRNQTAWQVRVLPNVGTGLTCDSTIAKWAELTAPSSARLTTGTDDSDPPSGPCEVPPSKGYRGPENQLYRVELHSATEFKWSRDNATITSAVDKSISTSRLRLTALGRDELLSIKSGDWVEVLDDRLELDHTPGEMRKVTVEEGNVILLDSPLPADLANSTHHLRVRKWDSGPIPIPASGKAFLLELGVTVTFTFAATGKPRPGDHWVFAARVADASVEKLTAAPPRGTHLHYAKLALLTIGGPVTDCRPDWPSTGESCGCEICVSPGDSLQEAIETLKKHNGGTITLCPGVYELEDVVKIDGARSIRIRGVGAATVLKAPNGVLSVTRSRDVVLENFAVSTRGDMPAVVFGSANRNCVADALRVTHEWEQGSCLGLSGVQQLLTIRNCLFTGFAGLTAQTHLDDKGLLTAGLSIQDNFFSCTGRGIDLGIDHNGVVEHTGLTSVAGNQFTACEDAGIVMTGLVPQDVAGVDGTLNIDRNMLEVTGAGIVTGGRASISGNTVVGASRVQGKHGIALQAAPPDTPDGVAMVLGNRIAGMGGTGIVVSAQLSSLLIKHNIVRKCGGGVLVQPAALSGRVSVDNNHVLDLSAGSSSLPFPGRLSDRFADRLRAEVAGQPSFREATADEPTLHFGSAAAMRASARVNPGITALSAAAIPTSATTAPASAASAASAAGGVGLAAGARSRVSAVLSEHLAASLVDRPYIQAAMLMGIAVIGVQSALISGNTIDGVAASDTGGNGYGILVASCVEARISGNMVSRIGSANSGGTSVGIGCAFWQSTMSVTDNTVRGETEEGLRAAWTPMLLMGVQRASFQLFRSAATTAGTWTFAGDSAYLMAQVTADAELTRNTLQGGGQEPAINVTVTGDVHLTGNRGSHPSETDREVARINAATAIAQGNRLSGGHPSLSITARSAAVAVGNITSGGIQINGHEVARDALNPIG